jgi:hypothetical protein
MSLTHDGHDTYFKCVTCMVEKSGVSEGPTIAGHAGHVWCFYCVGYPKEHHNLYAYSDEWIKLHEEFKKKYPHLSSDYEIFKNFVLDTIKNASQQ